MKKLFILRGVSGSGKSTLAKELSDDGRWPVCEADQFHYTEDGVYEWKEENIHKAHQWCRDKVELHMKNEVEKIIVSNTTTSAKELKPYLDLAENYCYDVTSVVVENYHGNESIHDVPQFIRDRQEARLRNSLKLQ